MANKNPILPPSNEGKEYRTLKINAQAQMFATFYLSPESDTFMNVRASAIRAGYSEQYANNITSQRPKWWIELTETANYKRAQMLNSAEDSLYETVTMPAEDREDKKLKHDAAKFISERLGKQHYSTRQELTGADGRRLFTNQTRNTANQPLETLFKGVETSK